MKGLTVFSWSFLFPQLLKGVTIASGGVLPNIHPELLKKRKGGKLVAPEELKPKKPKASTAPKQKAGTSGKKMPASPAKKTPEKSQASGKGKKKGVSTVLMWFDSKDGRHCWHTLKNQFFLQWSCYGGSTSTWPFFIYPIPGRIGICEYGFLRWGENWSTQRRTSWSKGENQQQS